jgi:pimeloyl-ACP methyl ester carboxylesterase
MPVISVFGTTLHYDVAGEGLEPADNMVLIHGFGDSGLLWKPQVQYFKDRYRVVTLDMRGHGRSGVPMELGLYTQDQVVEDVRAIMDHVGVDKAIVGGHSLGGYTSMRFYQRYPERVRAMILSGTGPGYRRMDGARQWTEINEKAAAEYESRGLDTVVDAREEKIGRHGGTEPIKHTLRGLAYVRLGVMRMPLLVDPREMHVPLIVMVGENDKAFLNPSSYIAAKAPHAKGPIVIKGATHWANFDDPETWNKAVDEFLEDLEG